MNSPRQFLEHLLERRSLSEAEAASLLKTLTAPDLAPAMAGALLTALRAKGVTADEVRGFAGAMRALAIKPALPAALDAIDIVGTGGDGSGSLNLSTGAALLAAACGLPIVKHGNRSISSRSGSADLIEAIGFSLPLDENRAAECFVATGFTFLFAPYFHPAMKALAPIRAALGIRTVFNLLGPLTNPAAPRFLLVGAYDAPTAELMAGTLAGMTVIYLIPPVAALVLGPVGWPAWLAWALMCCAYAPMLRYYGRSPLWAPFLPLVALFYVGATFASAVRYWRGKGGQWKSRVQAPVQER